MDLLVVRGDITTARVDAVVNAANSKLAGGGGVDAAIHRAAGPIMDLECGDLRRTEQYRAGLPTGQAVATSGGAMTARWVIHTVGPIYGGPDPRVVAAQQEQLRACYLSSLAVADRLGAGSVAFPLISAGAYRWPRLDAIEQALSALAGADTQVQTATLFLFDDESYELAGRVLRG